MPLVFIGRKMGDGIYDVTSAWPMEQMNLATTPLSGGCVATKGTNGQTPMWRNIE